MSAEIRSVQQAMNRFTAYYLESVTPLIVDGEDGPATRKRVRECKFFLGYSDRRRHLHAVGPEFLRRIDHPRSVRAAGARAVARGLSRRAQQRHAARANRAAANQISGVRVFDGHQVAAWIVPYLEWAREHGWQGHVNSGWRDPAYSERLCLNMCGRPSCPGRCAGRASNHSGSVKPSGAVDVSDYLTFKSLMLRAPFEPKLLNALPSTDPIHFSATGR